MPAKGFPLDPEERKLFKKVPLWIRKIQEANHGVVDLTRKFKQNLRKQLRHRILRTIVPTTEEQKRKVLVVKKNLVIVDEKGRTIAHYFHKLVPEDLLMTLESSTKWLVAHKRPSRGRSKRKDRARYHLGCWSKYMKRPQMTSESRNKYCAHWLKENRPLFKVLHDFNGFLLTSLVLEFSVSWVLSSVIFSV